MPDESVAGSEATNNTANQPQTLTVPSNFEKVSSIVSETTDKITELPFTPTQRAGYKLSIFILCIICGCLVLLFCVLIFNSSDAYNSIRAITPASSDTAFSHQKEIIKALQDEKKSYRDFVVQIAQMVLLNLLLPTLTAVLGYIFGSKEGSSKKTDNT